MFLRAMRGRPDRGKTVLCAGECSGYLQELLDLLGPEGFIVLTARSAAECIACAAECHPDAIVLDMGLLQVDQENIPEYLYHISSHTAIIILVENPGTWQAPPMFVHAVVARADSRTLLSILKELA